MARCAKVILHVSSLTLIVYGGVFSFELGEDRLVRLAESMREDVDAPAMCHRDGDFLSALSSGHVYCHVEHRNESVGAFDREALVALVGASDETFQTIHFGETPEDGFFLSHGERLVNATALDLVA